MYKLGVDIGGVIIDRFSGNEDTNFFSDNFLATPPVPGVFEALSHLADYFAGEVYLVSKAGPKTIKKSRLWLDHHNFWSRTGIREENLYFCGFRSEKAPIAQRLGLTAFIDDRLEVLNYLADIVGLRVLINAQLVDALELHNSGDTSVLVASDWSDVCEHLTGSSDYGQIQINPNAPLTQEDINRLLTPLNQKERKLLCDRMGWSQAELPGN